MILISGLGATASILVQLLAAAFAVFVVVRCLGFGLIKIGRNGNKRLTKAVIATTEFIENKNLKIKNSFREWKTNQKILVYVAFYFIKWISLFFIGFLQSWGALFVLFTIIPYLIILVIPTLLIERYPAETLQIVDSLWNIFKSGSNIGLSVMNVGVDGLESVSPVYNLCVKWSVLTLKMIGDFVSDLIGISIDVFHSNKIQSNSFFSDKNADIVGNAYFESIFDLLHKMILSGVRVFDLVFFIVYKIFDLFLNFFLNIISKAINFIATLSKRIACWATNPGCAIIEVVQGVVNLVIDLINTPIKLLHSIEILGKSLFDWIPTIPHLNIACSASKLSQTSCKCNIAFSNISPCTISYRCSQVDDRFIEHEIVSGEETRVVGEGLTRSEACRHTRRALSKDGHEKNIEFSGNPNYKIQINETHASSRSLQNEFQNEFQNLFDFNLHDNSFISDESVEEASKHRLHGSVASYDDMLSEIKRLEHGEIVSKDGIQCKLDSQASASEADSFLHNFCLIESIAHENRLHNRVHASHNVHIESISNIFEENLPQHDHTEDHIIAAHAIQKLAFAVHEPLYEAYKAHKRKLGTSNGNKRHHKVSFLNHYLHHLDFRTLHFHLDEFLNSTNHIGTGLFEQMYLFHSTSSKPKINTLENVFEGASDTDCPFRCADGSCTQDPNICDKIDCTDSICNFNQVIYNSENYINQINFVDSFQNWYNCWHEIETNPEVDPLHVDNLFKSDINSDKFNYCFPLMNPAWNLRAKKIEFSVKQSVMSACSLNSLSNATSCYCPAHYPATATFDYDTYAFLIVPTYIASRFGNSFISINGLIANYLTRGTWFSLLWQDLNDLVLGSWSPMWIRNFFEGNTSKPIFCTFLHAGSFLWSCLSIYIVFSLFVAWYHPISTILLDITTPIGLYLYSDGKDGRLKSFILHFFHFISPLLRFFKLYDFDKKVKKNKSKKIIPTRHFPNKIK